MTETAYVAVIVALLLVVAAVGWALRLRDDVWYLQRQLRESEDRAAEMYRQLVLEREAHR